MHVFLFKLRDLLSDMRRGRCRFFSSLGNCDSDLSEVKIAETGNGVRGVVGGLHTDRELGQKVPHRREKQFLVELMEKNWSRSVPKNGMSETL